MVKAFAQFYIAKILQFFPIVLFIYSYRITNSWETAFYIGGSLAALQTITFLVLKLPIERLLLAVNLFLAGGAVGMYYKIGWIEYVYDELMQGALLMWYALVGVITTLFSPTGFLGINHPNKKLIKLYSWYLLGVTVFLIGWSWYFKGESIIAFMLSGGLPFAVLIALHKRLVSKIEHASN